MTRTRLRRSERLHRIRGATTLEYSVLLGVLFAGTIAGAILLGGGVNDTMTNVDSGSGAGSGGGTADPGAGGGTGDPGSGDPGSGSGDSGTGGGTGNGDGSGGGTTTPPLREIFFDNFEKANNARWHFNGAWWQTVDGQLQAGPVSGWNELRAYVSASQHADGKVAFDGTLLGGSGFGLFFRLSGDPTKKSFNGYSFEFDADYGGGSFVIRKWVQGVQLHPPIAAAPPPAGFTWYGVPHHFELTTQGDVMKVAVDGREALVATDGSFSSGGIGFRLWNQAHARFDNVQVMAVSR